MVQQTLTEQSQEVDALKQKIIAGRNLEQEGLKSYTDAQFYENLTKEQYSGNYRPKIPFLGSRKESLNAYQNLQTVKNRLWVTDHYLYLHGVEHAHWPAFAIQRWGAHLYKYKFNFAVKAFFLYAVYRDIQNYRYLNSVTFMHDDIRFLQCCKIGWHALVAGGVCLII